MEVVSRAKLEENSPNYAYEVLLLEIIVEDDQYQRKPTIEEISRLIQLYMVPPPPPRWPSRCWRAPPTPDTTTSKEKSTL